ncbi:MAG: hypothetical protein GY913_13980 [Proteobacteria bacterium]|nr:hypothetical protein [Pseudomonadota bacterium]
MSLLLALACTGGPDEEVAPVANDSSVPAELLAGTWQVRVAAPGGMDAFGSAGWQAMFERNATGALEAFGPQGVESGRVHVQAAAAYRQAACVAAYALVETYDGDERREGDPAEVEYLLGVSRVVLGQDDLASGHFGQGGADESLAAADAAWTALAAEPIARAAWDDDALFPLPAVTAGTLPAVVEGPHYRFTIEGATLPLELADPTALLQAAWWHEAAATQAMGAPAANALLGPWRLEIEEPGEQAAELPIEALFLSSWSSADDLAFVNALVATEDPTSVGATVESFASRSAYAAVVQGCLSDAGVDPDCLEAGSRSLANALEASMAEAGGQVSADHRMFAGFATGGVLRAGARTEDALGNEYNAAVLRRLARDASTGPAADPVFFVALSAYHASTRNAHTSAELLHGQISFVPGLYGARIALDALNLRVQRDSGPGNPGG